MRVVLSRSAWFLLFLWSLISGVAEGQSAVVVHHQVKLGEVPVLLGEWQKSDSNVSIRIDKLRWYVSLPPAGKKGSKAWLLDLADSASLYQTYLYPTRSGSLSTNISLLFGIDSAIQVGGVGTGALDPLRGMYWTWQTGYVQWKMEGAIRVDGSESPLELHLGGFDGPTNAQVLLPKYLFDPTVDSVFANWDISPFLADVVRRKKFGVMSPSPIARDYCRIIASSVTFYK
jgi:hypothetical protein